MEVDLLIYTILLLIMYFLSGIKKINTFDSTVNSFSKKAHIELERWMYEFIIFCVIVLEIFVPAFIVYNIYMNNYNYWMFYAIIALIFFTILATLVYHYPPEGAAYYAFMANVTAIGGLFLLSYIIYNKINA